MSTLKPDSDTPPRQRPPFPSLLGLALGLLHCALLVFFAASRPDIGPPPRATSPATDFVFVDPYHSSGSVIAGRFFHFAHEPLPLKIVYLLDFPSLLISAGISFLTRAAGIGLYANSWVDGISWLLLGSLQWLWFGSLISGRRLRHSSPAGGVHPAA